jgi:hypothetical protein
MSKKIRNRDVSKTSSDLEHQAEQTTERPTQKEWLRRTALLKPLNTSPRAVEIIREQRDGR